MITPQSIETMSPSASTRFGDGMPWTTSLFTEVQRTAGKAVVALEGRDGVELVHFGGGGVLQVHRGGAGNHQRPHRFMHLAQRYAGAAHLLDLGGGFDQDRPWSAGTAARSCAAQFAQRSQRA